MELSADTSKTLKSHGPDSSVGEISITVTDSVTNHDPAPAPPPKPNCAPPVNTSMKPTSTSSKRDAPAVKAVH
ncbi:hypothetical protein BIW11_09189, partial [Tropilaelaps mercedesae]